MMDQAAAGAASIIIRLTVTVIPCVLLRLRRIRRHGRPTAALLPNIKPPFRSRGKTNQAFPSSTNRLRRCIVLFQNCRRRLRRKALSTKRFRSSVGCVDGTRKEPTMSTPLCRLSWNAQSNKQRLCRCRRTADPFVGNQLAMARPIPVSNPAPLWPTLRSQFRVAPDKSRMRWPLFLPIIVATEATSVSCITTKPIPTLLNFFRAIQSSNCRDQSAETWFRTNANCGPRSCRNLGMWSFTRALSAIKASKNLLRYLFIM